ncbi:hypothetical protein F4814DRAFT_422529 [Daldinia grandis]|nr:hypothetical protein F4814DRAFT_422529 [Daldinia grandis]
MSIRTRLPSPVSFPKGYSPPERSLFVKHPGYGNKYDPLLQFTHYGQGVDYELVIYACCVVAGNAWPLEMMGQTRNSTRPDGGKLTYAYLSLSEKPNPQAAITCPTNNILTGSIYFLHTTEPNLRYPFTPSFDHWVFPHEDLPPPWKNVDISPMPLDNSTWLDGDARPAALSRDVTCRISKSHMALECAYIIPTSENPWFKANCMGLYAGAAKIGSLQNSIILRKDVHHLWDINKEIILFPKRRGDTYHMVCHAFKTSRTGHFEIEELYHNRECQILYGISREYLFARFAWSIFRANTVTLLNGKEGPFTVLLSIGSARYPETKAKEFKLTRQIPPLPTLPHFGTPELEEPSEKRSLSRSNEKSRWYYSFDNQIEYLDANEDTDEDTVSCSAVGTDDDERVGRKPRRCGSESPSPLSQSFI